MINPHEAPEGYRAVKSLVYSCNGCEFSGVNRCDAPKEFSCGPINREDKTRVVFKRLDRTGIVHIGKDRKIEKVVWDNKENGK